MNKIWGAIDNMCRAFDSSGNAVVGTPDEILKILGTLPDQLDGAVRRLRNGYLFDGDHIEWDIPVMRGTTIIRTEKISGTARLKRISPRRSDAVIEIDKETSVPAWKVNVSLCRVKIKGGQA